MYTEGYEQWLKASKNLASPVNEWSKIYTEIFRRTADQQLEILEDNFSRISEQIKLLSNARRPEEFFNLQKDFFNRNATAYIEDCQKLIHLAMENSETLSRLFGSLQNPLTAAAKTTEKVTEKAQKNADKYAERHTS